MNTRATTTDPGARSAAEIEREVQQSRAEVEQTLDQIQERLSPGQLLDQAYGYFRGGSGAEFARNFGNTIVENPVPVTLLGVGLAWMIFSGQRATSRSPARDRRADWDDDEDVYEDEPYVYRDTPYTGETYEPGALSEAPPRSAYASGLDEGTAQGEHAPSPGERNSDAGHRVGERMSEMGQRAKEASRAAGQRAGELGASTGERVSDAGARVADATDRFRRRSRAAGAGAYRYGRRAQQGALRTISEHPLMLGALGLAIGAALGAAVPPSETEDELMGEAGHALKHRAAAAAREQSARVRKAAGAAYQAASEEAEEQGLTPEAAQEAASSVVDKAGHVASAAVSAAEKSASTDTKPPERSSTT
jgi:hypothetical protein